MLITSIVKHIQSKPVLEYLKTKNTTGAHSPFVRSLCTVPISALPCLGPAAHRNQLVKHTAYNYLNSQM